MANATFRTQYGKTGVEAVYCFVGPHKSPRVRAQLAVEYAAKAELSHAEIAELDARLDEVDAQQTAPLPPERTYPAWLDEPATDRQIRKIAEYLPICEPLTKRQARSLLFRIKAIKDRGLLIPLSAE